MKILKLFITHSSNKFLTKKEAKESAKKYLSNIDLIPPKKVSDNAKQSLEWHKQYGRGMTAVGLARARQLKNRQKLSIKTIKRMLSFFARHAVDKKAKIWKEGHRDGGPSNGKIAWYGWGGDEGWDWVKRISKKNF